MATADIQVREGITFEWLDDPTTPNRRWRARMSRAVFAALVVSKLGTDLGRGAAAAGSLFIQRGAGTISLRRAAAKPATLRNQTTMPTYRASEPTARPGFVPAGDYELEVLNAEETVSQKGHDMIELKLRAEPGGSVFFDHLVFMESSYWKIDAFRAAIGEKVMPDQEVEIHADDLIGRKGRARLIVEEYQGRKRNKVATWLLPTPANAKGGGGDQPF